MDFSAWLGRTFVNELTDARAHPLLVIGKDRWSYAEVAHLGVIQPRACRILSRIAGELKAKDTRDLYKLTSPYTLAGLEGCGVTTLYVALRAFAAKGLNVRAWYVRGERAAVRSFLTLKHREQTAKSRTLESERKRRGLRSTRHVLESSSATTH